MPVFVGDMCQVSFRGQCFGQRIILVSTYRCRTAPDASQTLQSVLADILTSVQVGGNRDIQTPYLACLPAEYTLDSVRAQWIAPTRSAYRDNVVGAPGTHESAATVANDSAALTLRTDNSGRDQVATHHIGPAPDAVSANGLIVLGYRLLVQTLGVAMIADIPPALSTGVFEPVIRHRSDGSYDNLSGIRVGLQSRVQRRRTVGIGE